MTQRHAWGIWAGCVGMVLLSVRAWAGSTMGADLRLRHEYWKNIFDQETSAKDNRNFFRLRSRVWGEAGLNEDLSASLRLTHELKEYTYYYQASGAKRPSFEANEVVVDNLYVDMKKVADLPLDLRIGRQDFAGQYGEGFLIMDGTPLDGSRTFYFNAVKGRYQIDEANSVDVIYINNPRTDKYLPIAHQLSPEQTLNQTDEIGVVVYWKNQAIDGLQLDPYYIYKEEDDVGGARLQDRESRIHTVGAFSVYRWEGMALRTQGAYQTGRYGDDDRQAFGGYAFLDKEWEGARSPKATGGVVVLSGNDPSTGTNEGWDPLFSRWPWMSELYCLSYNGESGMGYWTNLIMYRGQFEMTPAKKIRLTLAYNFLQAMENPASAGFGLGDGKNRGHLPQVKLGYQFSDHVSGYVLAEYLIPGNYYADGTDPSLFLRTELMVKF